MLDQFYNAIVRIDQTLHAKGILKTYRPKSKTICLGNLSMGGTGKTPIIIWLIEKILASDYNYKKIAVISRNYKSRSASYNNSIKSIHFPVAVDAHMENAASIFGDEAVLIKSKFPEVEVWTGPHKASTCKALEDAKGVFDLIIVDDGFQHWALKRDFDIVLIDPNDDKAFKVFPLGRGRESAEGLNRANAFIISKANWCESNQLKSIVKKIPTNKSIWYADFYLNYPELNSKQAVGVFCGLAKSEVFLQQINNKYPGQVIKTWNFDDHHFYTDSDINNLKEFIEKNPNSVLLTTEKDAVKVQDARLAEGLLCVQLSVQIEQQESLLEQIWSVLRKSN